MRTESEVAPSRGPNPCADSSVLRALCACSLVVGLSSLAACRATDRPAEAPGVSQPTAHLVAVLPMNEGYGPEEQDDYEAAIAPISASHGMARQSAFTVSKYLKGAGPEHASTVGVWDLASPKAMADTMADARYQQNVVRRDQIHDMPNAAMYMTKEEFRATDVAAGSTIVVGLLAMKPGYGFDEHHAYEAEISEITERHGMRLLAEYRVLEKLSPNSPDVAAINLWALDSPESLGAVMQDPEYAEHIEYRDEIHDMQTTTMYFTTRR